MLTNAIGYLCEAAYHHADLAITYAKPGQTADAPSAGGITDKDFPPWPRKSKKSPCGGRAGGRAARKHAQQVREGRLKCETTIWPVVNTVRDLLA